MYEHIYLEKIRKLNKTSGKRDDQQHYKAVIEAAMVSTPEGFTGNSPTKPNKSEPAKNPSARKSLH